MKFTKSGKHEVGINIAPLVDVVFLLVIFFAVSTTFLETSGLELELPESTATAKREAKTLTVSMDESGQLSFDGETLSRADLQTRLAEALEKTERKIVVLQADTHTEHGDVVRLMDLIRDAGAEGLTVDARAAAPE